MMASPIQGTLQCTDVSVNLGGRQVVDGVHLELRPGEWLGLIGPNGAGKTTLLRAIAGLVKHDGRVSLGDTAGLDAGLGEGQADREGAGFGARPGPLDLAVVPQHPMVPTGMTVTEYVMIGRTAHLGWLARESGRDRTIVAEVLRRLALEPFATRAMGALSGGETQRVVIARALAQQTPILLLDEPTSALDVGHQTEVLELVDHLRRADGLSVLSVMHDLTTAARFADRLALLDSGRLVTVGPAEDVLTPDLLSATYGTPLSVRVLDGELVVLPAPRQARPGGP